MYLVDPRITTDPHGLRSIRLNTVSTTRAFGNLKEEIFMHFAQFAAWTFQLSMEVVMIFGSMLGANGTTDIAKARSSIVP